MEIVGSRVRFTTDGGTDIVVQSSDVYPDLVPYPVGSWFHFGPWIRIRNPNADPDPEV